MEDEFPDPDEEYEMRYAEEFELMNEFDFEENAAPILPKGNENKVKKSLNFNNATSSGSRPSSSLSDQLATSNETGRKRMQDEMFGSLSDDDELCGKSSNPLKKARNDEIVLDDQSCDSLTESCGEPVAVRVPRPKRYVFRLVPEEPHQSITTHTGQKLFIRLKADESIRQKNFDLNNKNTGNLLKVSVASLKLQMHNEARAKSSLVSDEEFERRLRELEKMDYRSKGAKDDSNVNELTNNSNDSWMELYRPRNYLDLLSEEIINRTLLHWLKLWDKAVFNREVKIKAPKIDETLKPQWAQGQKSSVVPGRFENKKKFEKFRTNKQNEGELKEELDSSGRPLQKIVLISGPPGLGKTTLAHVVAKHAGYNPVEMNASDDRNVEAFKLQLEAATQMRSVIGSNPLPNCLIIDEIDGAPAASINFLVSTLTQEGAHNKENNQAKKKKKKGHNLVSRPVICICNDLYTPSLRPLRQAALVLQFPTTNPNRLAQRLLSISKEQEIQVDMSTMLALCEKADYDIRSCLATLYFLKSRRLPLRYSDVMNLNIGLKDNHKSLFQVWQEIFHIPRQKKSQYMGPIEHEGMLPLAPDVDKPLAPNAGNNASMPARFANILHSVHSCGEYDRLLQGVFENYPTIKFKDSYLSSVCTGLDWMCFYDHVNHFIQKNQNYCVFGYLPYTFIALHFQMAAVLSQKIKYPTAQTELNAKVTKNQSIVSTMFQDLKAKVRITNSKENIIQDVIPFSLPIITPTLRPVSAQLYSAEEKEQILRVIGVMISYNLTFRQEKTIDGAYRYCLEPDIEQVAYFDIGTVQRKSLTYSVKQMLAREIELEKLRLYESNLGPVIMPKPLEQIEPAAMKPPPNMAMTLALKPKPIVESCKTATDFFGRPLKTPPKKKNADGSVQTAQNDVWYHFKEGYSNAVRRSVKMADFL